MWQQWLQQLMAKLGTLNIQLHSCSTISHAHPVGEKDFGMRFFTKKKTRTSDASVNFCASISVFSRRSQNIAREREEIWQGPQQTEGKIIKTVGRLPPRENGSQGLLAKLRGLLWMIMAFTARLIGPQVLLRRLSPVISNMTCCGSRRVSGAAVSEDVLCTKLKEKTSTFND